MKKLLVGIIGLAAIIAVANAAYVTVPAYLEKSKDIRNDKVTMIAHMRWGIDPTTLVIDVLSISPLASMADVDRSLFDIAEGFKNYSFSNVHLSYRGSSKFQMDGKYFQKIGAERIYQNPVYLIRTMPENIRDMSGRPAFSTWTGGLIGVVGQQMDDHNNMHRQWYLEEAVRAL